QTAVVNSSMILFIVGAAGVFGFVMTKAQIPEMMANTILGITDNPLLLLLLINIMLLIIGMFLETNAAILIVSPIFLSLIENIGMGSVHFGIVMIVNLSIGLITPPLGVNLFVDSRLKENVRTVDVLNRHLIVYVFIALLALALITYISNLVLFLPNLFN